MPRLLQVLTLGLVVFLVVLGLVYQRRQDLMIHAAHRGTLPVLKAMLWLGADPRTTTQGSYPLYAAVWEGQMEAAELLVLHGADLDSKEPSGATPLMAAASRGDDVMVRFLVQRGASLTAACGAGNALDQAIKTGHLRTAEILRLAGARPTSP